LLLSVFEQVIVSFKLQLMSVWIAMMVSHVTVNNILEKVFNISSSHDYKN